MLRCIKCRNGIDYQVRGSFFVYRYRIELDYRSISKTQVLRDVLLIRGVSLQPRNMWHRVENGEM